jgi:hypothetical protein
MSPGDRHAAIPEAQMADKERRKSLTYILQRASWRGFDARGCFGEVPSRIWTKATLETPEKPTTRPAASGKPGTVSTLSVLQSTQVERPHSGHGVTMMLIPEHPLAH